MFGGAPGAVIGAGAPIAAGAGAKSIANMLAKRSVKSVDELLRKRSPLYQERLAASPMEAEKLAQREAIARLLFGTGLAQPRQ